jgi:hypothetical protein
MNSSISVPIERYWGIDLHKHYLVVGGVNAKQEIVLSPRRVDLDVWPKWAQAQLTPADVVVVEATTNAWDFYDVTSPLVQRVVVANAAKIALIAKNRLQSLLHRHHLVLPSGHPFTAIHRAWWDTLPVSPTERLHLKHDLATLAQLNTQVAEIDDEVQRVSCVVPWSKRVTYLIQLPGIGLITAMTILSAIGDITRFEHAKELVGYAGLGASVHDSGQTHRTGRITKQGRKELRTALVEAAWSTVEYSGFWKAEFERLGRRLDQMKAIVAIARKLLVVIWHVLTAQVADRHADVQQVATKLMRWSWSLTEAQRGGLTSRQFIRYQLVRLQLGDDLTHLRYGNMPRRIASIEEVLSLKPEPRRDA